MRNAWLLGLGVAAILGAACGGIVDIDDTEPPEQVRALDPVCAPRGVPLPDGTACTSPDVGHLCLAGRCVPYIPVRCEVGGAVHVCCDGELEPDHSISWNVDGSVWRSCHGSSADIGYCAPGSDCTAEISGETVFGTCR